MTEPIHVDAATVQKIRDIYIWGPRKHADAVAEAADKLGVDVAVIESVVGEPREPVTDEHRAKISEGLRRAYRRKALLAALDGPREGHE